VPAGPLDLGSRDAPNVAADIRGEDIQWHVAALHDRLIERLEIASSAEIHLRAPPQPDSHGSTIVEANAASISRRLIG